MVNTRNEIVCTVKPKLGNLLLNYGPMLSLYVSVPNKGILQYKDASDLSVAEIKMMIRYRFRINDNVNIRLEWANN